MYIKELEKPFTPNNIKIIMNTYNLSIKDISERFEIPYRTVQNWVSGVSNPPAYVIKLIWNNIINESIIEENKIRERNYYNILDRASDLLHDSRIKEAISLIDNA